MESLEKELGIKKVDLIKGSGGIFTVAVNDIIVASKQSGQFPTEAEIVKQVKNALEN